MLGGWFGGWEGGRVGGARCGVVLIQFLGGYAYAQIAEAQEIGKVLFVICSVCLIDFLGILAPMFKKRLIFHCNCLYIDFRCCELIHDVSWLCSSCYECTCPTFCTETLILSKYAPRPHENIVYKVATPICSMFVRYLFRPFW